MYLHLKEFTVAIDFISAGMELKILCADTGKENSQALILALAGTRALEFRVLYGNEFRRNKFWFLYAYIATLSLYISSNLRILHELNN